MVLKLNFKGPMAPVFTPFSKCGAVNYDVIPKFGNYLSNAGVKGVLVNGTAGEGVSMTIEERKLVLEEWMKVAKVKKFNVMVQIGGRCLKEVKELAKHAEDQGVDSILCLPDLFFRPKSTTELVNYLKIVGESASSTPLFYYHIPSFTGVTLDMAEFLREGKDELPTLGGIKFTHNNLQEGADCLTVNRDELTVFLGNEQTLAGACTLGFDSCIIIGVNLLPDVVINIMNSVQKNNNKDALKYQNILSTAMAKITKNGFFPGTKAAMSFISGLEMGDPRPPQVPFNIEQLAQLKKELADLNLLP